MLMNRTDLLCTIQHEIAKTIEPMVTEYMRNHPEYFRNCINSDGLISSVYITLSYQPDKINEVKTTVPSVFTRVGGPSYGEECDRFSHAPESLYYTTWVSEKKVAEYEEDL